MKLDVITKIIIVLAIINLLIYVQTHVKIRQLDRIVHPNGNLRFKVQSATTITDDGCIALSKSSDIAAACYTLYTNITALFPLLGIFGTVVSLMKSSGADTLPDNFSMALTTTAAGLIAAMFFKILDSFISSRLDRALDDADYLIHQHDEEKRKGYVPQEET